MSPPANYAKPIARKYDRIKYLSYMLGSKPSVFDKMRKGLNLFINIKFEGEGFRCVQSALLVGICPYAKFYITFRINVCGIM